MRDPKGKSNGELKRLLKTDIKLDRKMVKSHKSAGKKKSGRGY